MIIGIGVNSCTCLLNGPLFPWLLFPLWSSELSGQGFWWLVSFQVQYNVSTWVFEAWKNLSSFECSFCLCGSKYMCGFWDSLLVCGFLGSRSFLPGLRSLDPTWHQVKLKSSSKIIARIWSPGKAVHSGVVGWALSIVSVLWVVSYLASLAPAWPLMKLKSSSEVVDRNTQSRGLQGVLVSSV